ncbi:L-allo-threonine aldolase [Anaerohalosphaera lusitana]|uniref:L-allo-threonine aldolase n=1 Tax=Anaerohalosphaera lusitana TaxID=1936003 RepID=A0A1U9NQG3_9BACT|nr:low-specificity L-threonine aldolase [Anaerohalosphaera lusitana]AQT70173.1 L-allo-threonine aldolase [Anaerohalosphaera lusitana]
MGVIDLRSDTVTQPTVRMREAMRDASVGDDVLGDDPTVQKLERLAVDKLGTEAAIFVPSGTMGNLVSAMVHCPRGSEVILGDKAHMFVYEAGGMSAAGGIQPHTIPNQADGTLRLEDIEHAVRAENVHFPRTRLICLENTQNKCGGRVLRPEYCWEVREIADKHALKMHLDGARVYNAAVALGIDVRELAEPFDSVSVCLSKGLSAPVGSVVCGRKDFVYEARRARKLLGGGMRQAGVLAAAGIVALEDMVDRLSEDHANAKELARGLAETGMFSLDAEAVETNIVYFDLAMDKIGADELVAKMAERGVLFLALGPGRFRMVTHCGISAGDVETALDVLGGVAGELQ